MTNGRRKIEAKEATEIAKRYMSDVLGAQPFNLSLEEIELSDDGKYWLITLGYPKSYAMTPEKEYKILKIDAFNRTVLSMKIRKIE